ncbi:hypothetical protein ACTFIZ_011955 [Dictyostelium cf. discoideum]
MSINSKYTIGDVLLNKESLHKKNKYSCPICFEFIYKKPIYQCRSGHFACQECWEKSLENKNECMICRSEVNSFKDLSRCLIIEQDFGKKECYCIYSYTNNYFIDGASQENEKRKDELNGCKEIINVDQLDNHIQYCKFKFVKCSHNGCDEILRLNSLEEHENQCDFKLFDCIYCGCDDIIQMELENHYNQCPKISLSCPQGCLEIIKRDEVESHIESDCNNTTVPCKYYEYGCKTEMKRKQLQNHLHNENHQIFMDLLIEKLSSTISKSNKTQDELVKKIEQSEKTQDELVKNIEQSEKTQEILRLEINELQKYSHTYKNKWIISNFSNVKSDILTSQPFNFRNHEFRIVLNINSGFGTQTFIKLETHQVPFHFKYICTLVNNNSSNSIEFKGTNNSHCLPKCFLTLTDFKNGWFDWLSNDQLRIKIFIKKINFNPPLES